MGYVWQRWIADELRKADPSVKVIEVAGWKNRGRPASTGAFEPNDGPTTHHTAGHSSKANPHPTLKLLIEGRSDLPGPLCHVSVAYDGTIYVIAAGRANHAGKTDKAIVGLPAGVDGNAHLLGNEVDTDGTQALSPAQRHSIALFNRVAIDHFHNTVRVVHRHADLTVRKWDIGSISTAALKVDAANFTPKDEDMPLTEAELDKIVNRLKPVINAAAEAEGEKTRTTIRNLVGDVVASDPAVWGDPAANTTVKASTALARILDALGKEQSQPGQ